MPESINQMLSDFENMPAENLEAVVFRTLGYASACWDPYPTGVFESDKARLAGETLVRWINDNLNELLRLRDGADRGSEMPAEAFSGTKAYPDKAAPASSDTA